MASQEVSSPGEGRHCVHYESDWELQGASGQAVDGESEDLKLQGAALDEQEERDGWLESRKDAV